MNTPLEFLLSDASASRAVIALSEGSDPRVVEGGLVAERAGVANILLVGDGGAIRAELERQGAEEGRSISVHDPSVSPLTMEFAQAYRDLRRHKGVDEAAADAAARTPLVYAAMLVHLGHADGTVGGAVATTSEVARAAIRIIGKASDSGIVSSLFLMLPPENAGKHARTMVYADCGLTIDPSASELASIAAASADSCRALLQQEPRIAMLSFSTRGSAEHPAVDKVRNATAELRDRRPDLSVDGELQFDAAFVSEIAARKSPGSPIAGNANVMIFPDLDAGNIAYKITQRIGGYVAIGPIFQGLARPANDLSRGCSAGDVTQMIAVTALQARARMSE